ncbi:MAG: trypsin-like peptidase domain-containing protein [Acidimicrobiales bacterium]|nr:serine protease [Acidimicrobiia bacterium]NNC81764.1 trypsin-like peptidase domain-containing protein [Acidimicrobiales bacterium]
MSAARSLAILCAAIIGLAYFAASSPETVAAERMATFETTACGDGSRTNGTGVVVRDGTILTAAHPVFRSGSITVRLPNGEPEPATIVALDLAADLALVEVESASASPIEFAIARSGDEVVVAAASTGASRSRISRAIDVRIEEVGGPRRISRIGYELDVNVALGDSGSGVYDTSGQLIGIVYGRNPDGELRSFVTGKGQLAEFLERDVDTSEVFRCDPDQSRVILKE